MKSIVKIFGTFTPSNWLALISIIITFVSVCWSIYFSRQENQETIKSNKEEDKNNEWHKVQITRLINNQIKSNKEFLKQFKSISGNLDKSFIQKQKEEALVAIKKFNYIWKIYSKARNSKNKDNKYSYIKQIVRLYSAWRNYLIENIAYKRIIINSIKDKKINKIQKLYNCL